MRVSVWIRTSAAGKASWRRQRQHRKEKAGGGQTSVRWEVAGGRFINCSRNSAVRGKRERRLQLKGKRRFREGFFHVYLFIWLCWVLVAAHEIFIASYRVFHGLSSCGAWAQQLSGMWDLSSPTRDQTHVPCIARWIPNHRTTREVPGRMFLTGDTQSP